MATCEDGSRVVSISYKHTSKHANQKQITSVLANRVQCTLSPQLYLASFQGLPRLQFLIACSIQKWTLRFCILQAIKNWRWGRPGNKAKFYYQTLLFNFSRIWFRYYIIIYLSCYTLHWEIFWCQHHVKTIGLDAVKTFSDSLASWLSTNSPASYTV